MVQQFETGRILPHDSAAGARARAPALVIASNQVAVTPHW